MNTIKIGIIGDYNPKSLAQLMTGKSLHHAAVAVGITVEEHWIPTKSLLEVHGVEILRQFDGIWGGPGDVNSLNGSIEGIRFAREHNIPYIGTCAGFQYAVLEFARNVLGIVDATTAEFNPKQGCLVITPLGCNIAGKKMVVNIASNTLAHCLYGCDTATEEYFCRFGINPLYQDAILEAGLKITGYDSDGEPRIFELSNHPFFLASLFVPQTSSTPECPHPLITGFVVACRNNKSATTKTHAKL